MDFDTRVAFKSILKGIAENKIMPRYTQTEYISYFIFPLGGDMDIEFTYHRTEDSGFVLLNFSNTAFDFCIEVGEYKNVDAPFATEDMITQKEVYDFVMSYKKTAIDSATEIGLLAEMCNYATRYLRSPARAEKYVDNPERQDADKEKIREFLTYVGERRNALGERELIRSCMRDIINSDSGK